MHVPPCRATGVFDAAKILLQAGSMLRRTLLTSSLAASTAFAQSDPWETLRKDGIALLRHATAPGVGDPRGFRLDDCGTQRNLNDAGRSEATRIGAMFRANRVPVGRVLSSAWCRCLETARLMDLGPVVVEPALNSFFDQRQDEGPQSAALLDVLEEWAGPGCLVCVTHQVNILALTRVYPRSGETVVLGPAADGFRVAGTIPAP